MTVSAQTPINSYVYAGSATFVYSFQVLLAGDLVVSVNGVIKTLGADYTQTGIGALGGGSITYTGSLTTGQIVTLRRSTALQRTNDYQSNGDFLAATVNADFDRLWMAAQEYSSVLNQRPVRAPLGEALNDLPAAAARANLLLSFDSSGQPIVVAPVAGTATALSAALAASSGSSLVGHIASGTGAIAETLQTAERRAVWSSQYATLQQAVNAAAAGNSHLYVVGANVVSAAVILASNMEITIFAGATISSNTPDIVILDVTGRANVKIKGPGKIINTATGTTSGSGTIGLVSFNGATDCSIEGVVLTGQTWAGVLLASSTRCAVRFCYINGAVGTLQDSADIGLYGNTVDCIVQANWCMSGSEHGILLQDPYAGLLPSRNLIQANDVGQHTAYGIIVYVPGLAGVGDTNNTVIGNRVRDIQGSYATNRSSGAGIYVVGNWAGGTQVLDNHISNCCVQTLDRALAPGGIGVNGIQAGVTRPVITGNTITGMTQGDGIIVTSSPGGCVVDSKSITLLASNNGTGAGGATLVGSGIRIENSSNVTIVPGDINALGAGSGILVYANGMACTDISAAGAGVVQSAAGGPLRVIQSGGFTTNDFQAIGFRVKSTSDSPNAVQLQSVVGGLIDLNASCGNSAAAQPALSLNACTQLRVRGKYISAGSAITVATAGVCTGTTLEKGAYWGISSTTMSNAGTGARVEWQSNAAPATGTWAVGDRTEQSVPVVGQPKGWRCTVAGAPGTWVSEGNL